MCNFILLNVTCILSVSPIIIMSRFLNLSHWPLPVSDSSWAKNLISGAIESEQIIYQDHSVFVLEFVALPSMLIPAGDFHGEVLVKFGVC